MALAATGAIGVWGVPSAAQHEVTALPRTAAIEAFLQRDVAPPPASRTFRRLEAENPRRNKRGWLEAVTSFDTAHGFTYQILAEGGSSLIRGRVLKPALEAESAELRINPRQSAIIPDNYEINELPDRAEGLISLHITAKRKERTLLNGLVTLAAEDGRLVKVEGRLAKSPSFWTPEVDIERTYARIGGVNVPVEVRSRTNVRWFGASEFLMTIRYESIDGVPVQSVDAAEVGNGH